MGVRLRIARLLQRLLAVLVCLTAAAPAGAAAVTDMLGRSLTLPDRSLRVVSLAPSLTEAAFALGRGDWLVGITDVCNYPPATQDKPRVGAIGAPNLERIVDLRPDLVLVTAEGNSRETMWQLERLRIPVFAVAPEGYADVLASLRVLGAALQAEAAAAVVVERIEADVAKIRRAVAGRPHPRALYLIWTDPLIAAGPGTFIHDLLELAGGANVVRGSVPYPRIGWEEVVAAAPEVILVAAHRDEPDGAMEAALRDAWRTWQSVPAIRAGRIVAIPADSILRPGPRVADGLARLAMALHPEVAGRRP